MTAENIANHIFEMEDSGEWRQEELVIPERTPDMHMPYEQSIEGMYKCISAMILWLS